MSSPNPFRSNKGGFDTALDLDLAFTYLQSLRQSEMPTAWNGLVSGALAHMIVKEHQQSGVPEDTALTEGDLHAKAFRLLHSNKIEDVLQPLSLDARYKIMCSAVRSAAAVLGVPPSSTAFPRSPTLVNEDVNSGAEPPPTPTLPDPSRRTLPKLLHAGYCHGANEPKFPTAQNASRVADGPSLYDRPLTPVLNPSWTFQVPGRGGGCFLQTIKPQVFRNPSANGLGPHFLGPSPSQLWNPAPTNNLLLGLGLPGVPGYDYPRVRPESPKLPMSYLQPEFRGSTDNKDTISHTLPICIPPMHLPSNDPKPAERLQMPVQALPVVDHQAPPAPSAPVLNVSIPQEATSKVPEQAEDIPTLPMSDDASTRGGRGRGQGRGRGGGGRGRGRGRGGGKIQSAPALPRISTDEKQVLPQLVLLPTPDATPTSDLVSPTSPLANKPTKRGPRKRKSSISEDGNFKSSLPAKNAKTKQLPTPPRTRKRTSEEHEKQAAASSSVKAEPTPPPPKPAPQKRRQSKLNQVMSSDNIHDE